MLRGQERQIIELDRVAYRFWKFYQDELVGSLNQLFKFVSRDGVEVCDANPFVAANVGGWVNAFAFDKLGKLFRRAFDRHTALDGIDSRNAKHFRPDAKTKIGSPFNILGSTGE